MLHGLYLRKHTTNEPIDNNLVLSNEVSTTVATGRRQIAKVDLNENNFKLQTEKLE